MEQPLIEKVFMLVDLAAIAMVVVIVLGVVFIAGADLQARRLCRDYHDSAACDHVFQVEGLSGLSKTIGR